MNIIIVKDHDEMSIKAAEIVNEQLIKKPNSVLGLATGGTPERMYELLIKANQEGLTNWAKVKTFNLDEYVGISSSHPMSYRTYMNEKLFSKVNIDLNNTFIPSNEGDINKNGVEYDKKIELAGGIDLQILGIGENSHIAFNEPGSKETDGTREVSLTESTIKANSRYFSSEDEVPRTAITMGIGTILKAKKIVLMASGKKKAYAVRSTIDGSVTEFVPASFLQKHKDVTIIIDEDAAHLTREFRETALCNPFK